MSDCHFGQIIPGRPICRLFCLPVWRDNFSVYITYEGTVVCTNVCIYIDICMYTYVYKCIYKLFYIFMYTQYIYNVCTYRLYNLYGSSPPDLQPCSFVLAARLPCVLFLCVKKVGSSRLGPLQSDYGK